MNKQNENLMKVIENEIIDNMAEGKDADFAKWWGTLKVCLSRIDEEQYGVDLLHNVAVFLGLCDRYRVIDDRVVSDTQLALIRDLGPIIGVPEHPVFELTDNQEHETVLPGSTWLLRTAQCKVRKNKDSYAIRITNSKSLTDRQMHERMNRCERAIQESKN